MTARPIYTIANDIANDWGEKVNFAAMPYLQAMLQIRSVDEMYGMDSAESIIIYFLSNATTYRGDTARRLKNELREILKGI